MRASTKPKRHGNRPPADEGDGGPTQLRQPSYVAGQRPGAYWEAPGVAAVRAPAPAPLPSPQQAAVDADPDPDAGLPAATTPDASLSHRRSSRSRDPDVPLEAERVLSILVSATPVRADPIKRRTVVILLAIVAIAAGAAIAAGVIVGASSRWNPAPVPAPSAASTTTPAPSAAPTTPAPVSTPSTAKPSGGCEAEGEALAACIDGTGNMTACLDCIEVYAGASTVVTCDDAAAVTCGIQAACPDCGTCQDEQVAIVNCQDLLGCDAFEC